MNNLKLKYKYGIEYILNFIYREKHPEADDTMYINIDEISFSDILSMNFSSYTMAHILDYYHNIQGAEYAKKLIEENNISPKIIKLLVQIEPRNSYIIPKSYFTSELIEYLLKNMKLGNRDIKDYYDPRNDYLILRSGYYSNSFYKKVNSHLANIDVILMNLSNQSNTGNTNRILNYLYRDRIIEDIEEVDLKQLKHIDIKSNSMDDIKEFGFTAEIFTKINEFYKTMETLSKKDKKDRYIDNIINNFDKYDATTIQRIIAKNDRVRKSYIEYIKKDIERFNYFDLPMILSRDPVVIEIYTEYIIKNPDKYNFTLLPIEITKNKRVVEAYIEYIMNNPNKYSIFTLPPKILNDVRVMNAYKLHIINNPVFNKTDYARLPQEIAKDPEVIEAYTIYILNHINAYKYDELPKIIASDERIKDSYKRTKLIYDKDGKDIEGYDENWLDKEGNIKQFFEIKTYNHQLVEIKTKEDYIKLVKNFCDGELPLEEYCRRYKINPIEGFRLLLDRISEENQELREKIKEKNLSAKEISFAKLKDRTERVYNGELTLTELLLKPIPTSCTLNNMISYISNNPFGLDINEFYKIIAKELYDYISDYEFKLNIKKLSEFLNVYPKSENSDILTCCEPAADRVKKIITNAYPSNSNREKHEKAEQAAGIIRSYKIRYDRDKLISKVMVYDELKDVTEDHIEQMLAYLEINHIPKNLKNANHFLKLIAMGEIDYSKETEDLKTKKRGALFELRNQIITCDSIDDYLSYVDSSSEYKEDESNSKGLV